MLRSTQPPSPTSGDSGAPASSSSDRNMVGGGGGAPSSAKLLQILNVRMVGSGERVVVLSHGFGTDQSAWSRVLPYLTRDHRVVLYDLVCAGSVNPEHFDFRRYNTLDTYVDDLLAILDALLILRCAFVCHSVSAMIGILASIRRPELFAKLVLIGASPRFLNDHENDYHGGFELPEILQVFDAMKANYSAWATGYAPLAVGADVPAAVQEFSRTLFNMRPDISLHVCQTVFNTDLAACWAWCASPAWWCRPPATSPSPPPSPTTSRRTSAAAPPWSSCRRRATSRTSARPASSPRCSAAPSPGTSSKHVAGDTPAGAPGSL